MMLILHVIYDHRQVGFKAHGWIPETLESGMIFLGRNGSTWIQSWVIFRQSPLRARCRFVVDGRSR